MGKVTLRDGIHIELADGTRVVADATDPDSDINVYSHAHGDHLYDSAPSETVASSLTLDLAEVRRPDEPRPTIVHPDPVTLLPAGHIPGSRAFLLEGEERYLYTGDLSVRSRFGLDGFEPVDADVLIIESTYGRPTYRFPSQNEVEAQIVDWLEETADTPVILMGYALGRAQELIDLAERAARSRIFVTTAIDRLNEPIEAATDRSFDIQLYSKTVSLGPGDALVLPAQTNSLDFVDRIREETGAAKAGFSGWAIEDSYRFARDVDAAFPLSDHADFEELLSVVEAVDPDRVYTVHGFVDDFAVEIHSRLGIESRALKPGQSTLSEF